MIFDVTYFGCGFGLGCIVFKIKKKGGENI